MSELARTNYQGGIVLVSGVDASMLDIARHLAVESGLKLIGTHTKPVSMATLAATLHTANMTQ